MDEAESCDTVGFIFNGKIINIAPPRDLIRDENARNLEDIFISYVERVTGKKVSATFSEMKFLTEDSHD
jgi:ABC-2 type transport system ATP-binding protein